MMSPAGGYAAALAGAAKATEVGVSTLARKLSKEGQAEERQNEADLDALKRNEFGPTRTQQEQMVADATSLARQQAQAARAEAARQRAATGYVMGGQNNDAATIKAAAETGGQARKQVADWAAQQAAKAKMEAFNRVSARAQDTYDKVASIHQAGEQAFDNAGGLGGTSGAAGGVPGQKDATGLRNAYKGGQ